MALENSKLHYHFKALQERVSSTPQTLNGFVSILQRRIKIEENYAKEMMLLSEDVNIGQCEQSTTRSALDMLRGTLLTKSEQHSEFAEHLLHDVMGPLEALALPQQHKAQQLIGETYDIVKRYKAAHTSYSQTFRRMQQADKMQKEIEIEIVDTMKQRNRVERLLKELSRKTMQKAQGSKDSKTPSRDVVRKKSSKINRIVREPPPPPPKPNVSFNSSDRLNFHSPRSKRPLHLHLSNSDVNKDSNDTKDQKRRNKQKNDPSKEVIAPRRNSLSALAGVIVENVVGFASGGKPKTAEMIERKKHLSELSKLVDKERSLFESRQRLSENIVGAQVECREAWDALVMISQRHSTHMSGLLFKLQHWEEERSELLRSQLRQLSIFESAMEANLQYDIQLLARAVDSIDFETDLKEYVVRAEKEPSSEATFTNLSPPPRLSTTKNDTNVRTKLRLSARRGEVPLADKFQGSRQPVSTIIKDHDETRYRERKIASDAIEVQRRTQHPISFIDDDEKVNNLKPVESDDVDFIKNKQMKKEDVDNKKWSSESPGIYKKNTLKPGDLSTTDDMVDAAHKVISILVTELFDLNNEDTIEGKCVHDQILRFIQSTQYGCSAFADAMLAQRGVSSQLSQLGFTLLTKLIRQALYVANDRGDLYFARNVMGLVQTFYTNTDISESSDNCTNQSKMNENNNRLLLNEVKTHPIWHNVAFWEKTIFSAINHMRSKNYGTSNSKKSQDLVVYVQLEIYSYNMCSFDIDHETVSKLMKKFCAMYTLDDETWNKLNTIIDGFYKDTVVENVMLPTPVIESLFDTNMKRNTADK